MTVTTKDGWVQSSGPKTSVLPDNTEEFFFKGMRLHGYCTEIADDFQRRLAVHEFDRRPGAMTEDMNTGPIQYRASLVFITDLRKGIDGFSDAKNFKTMLEDNPSGIFVHPIHGERQMTCAGWQNATISSSTPNTYTMQVSFIDNTIDPILIGKQSTSVQAYVASVNNQSGSVISNAGSRLGS